ncbi:putative membrane protein [Rhodopirellula maiorica SM1]|uniref:Putative membrane protein n=1 Tax=Rhodopirellula maiorica SM1 TaxID=1265738 RepID=M5RRD4_9BACT|nr:VanZ family protein [Rhodopirellula maiorica]EMI16529.1 putative membrane protein [Rhodopirellula maiorica SM1]
MTRLFPTQEASDTSTAVGVLGWSSLAVSMALVVVSWAPFNFRPDALAAVCSQLIIAGTASQYSRADFVANIVITIPLGFFLIGFFDLQTRSLWRRNSSGAAVGIARSILLTAITLVASGSLGLLCETGQGWLPTRVASLRDVKAQLTGALFGVVTWWCCGPRIAALITQVLRGQKLHSRINALVSLTAIGMIVWSIAPFDLILSPVSIVRKWTRGQIELVPFTSYPILTLNALYQWVASYVLGIPLGIWARRSTAFLFVKGLSRSNIVLVAIALGGLPELLQIPIEGRVASSTDAIFTAIGVGSGLLVAPALFASIESPGQSQFGTDKKTSKQRWMTSSSDWFLMAMIYGVLWSLLSWYPFDFVTDSEQLKTRLNQLCSSPFHDVETNGLKTLFVVFRAFLLSVGLGALLGGGASRLSVPSLRTTAKYAILPLAFLTALIIEAGQLLEATRTAGGIGFLTQAGGIWLGFSAARVTFQPSYTED